MISRAFQASDLRRCREPRSYLVLPPGSAVTRPGPAGRPAWGGTYSAQITAQVLAVKGRECKLELPGCIGTATTADHIVPRSRGGSDDMANLVPACRPCNSSKGDGLSEGPPVDLPDWLT